MSPNRAITGDFTTDPWWWEAARPWPSDEEPLPAATDVLVVGAGYTGLSAALTLAEAGREVLVLDRLMPGEAASSRNAGFVGRSLLGGFSRMASRLGQGPLVPLHRDFDRSGRPGHVQGGRQVVDFQSITFTVRRH